MHIHVCIPLLIISCLRYRERPCAPNNAEVGQTGDLSLSPAYICLRASLPAREEQQRFMGVWHWTSARESMDLETRDKVFSLTGRNGSGSIFLFHLLQWEFFGLEEYWWLGRCGIDDAGLWERVLRISSRPLDRIESLAIFRSGKICLIVESH